MPDPEAPCRPGTALDGAGRKRLLEPAASLRPGTAGLPVAAGPTCDPQRPRAEAVLERPPHRRPQVGKLSLYEVEPPGAVPAPEPSFGVRGESLVERAVTFDHVLTSRAVELVAAVFADRLEHPEAVGAAAQKALVDERGECLEVGPADLLDRFERRTPGEHREAGGELALLRREEVERPRDRRAQRLLTRVGVAGALEQVEAAAEALEDLLRPQHRGAGRGELDRKRQVVQAGAELLDVVSRPEAGVYRGRAGGEEVETLHRSELGDGKDVLARELEALAARDDELRAVEVAQGGDRVGGVREQVLGVVEHEQHPLAVEHLRQHVLERPVGLLDDVEHARRVPEYEPGVTEGRQRHEPDALGEVVRSLRCGL